MSRSSTINRLVKIVKSYFYLDTLYITNINSKTGNKDLFSKNYQNLNSVCFCGLK